MRLITFTAGRDAAAHIGVRQGKRIVDLDEAQIKYLPPIPDADKFLCLGKNYRQHLEELRSVRGGDNMQENTCMSTGHDREAHRDAAS